MARWKTATDADQDAKQIGKEVVIRLLSRLFSISVVWAAVNGGQGGCASTLLNQSVISSNAAGRLIEKLGETDAIPNRFKLTISAA
ncbi:hypothetical protein [Rhizobium sp. BK491]|uniref:hypothetical protein n=1 Tax=Rhizobium sp. BK491 TaxID=2587009 RepID=UPI00161C57FB|nr:hypothetical protein [Rhizobium sp. BK491]MBB3567591.1 hypothetical protein [Rhizobium sp. BK491]